MARIADEVIKRIKEEVSLLRLAESQGYQPKKQGKDYAVCCPFHDDKNPSCVISPKNNLFNCFSCGAGGSVIDWVMKTQGVSFRHAVELLKNDIDPSLLAAEQPTKYNTVPKLEAPISTEAEDQKVLQDVIGFYHDTLKQSPEALEYLEKRGLNNPELVNHFKLGYANRTLGLRLPHKNRKAGQAMRSQLQKIGLLRESGHEHFNGSLVIPVVDECGNITEVYGRKLLDTLRKGTPKHTYLPGPHQGVFNWQGLANTDEMILCESLIDTLTFWRWGFKHVTCSYGVNGFTDEILQALLDHKIQRVLIAYDRDEAGNRSAEEVAEKLKQNGIDAFRILFPKGMDANQYALKMSPPEKSLALVIRKAEWMGNGKPPERQLDIATQEPSFASEPYDVETALKAEIEEERAPEIKPEIGPVNDFIDTRATPVPPRPQSDVEVKHDPTESFIQIGDRRYRVRGLDKNTSGDQLKIQLMVKREDALHMDKLDLYSSKQRQVFINQACMELGVKDEVIKKDLGKVLLALEAHQNQQEEKNKTLTSPEIEINPEEKKAALELLNDPSLLSRLLQDFNRAGVVGEETNKLAGYLASVSRKLDKPLAVMIQSSSAAGKSSLMDSILNFMPEEERTQYSAMTGQSLFYMGETNLKHKILAISEEEGASNASYALKLLQSEGEVTIASTGKDDSTGNLITKEYKVEGPVMLFMTTTAIDIDEELMNRCLVLSVNESREQTEAIHAAQRAKRTLAGLQNKVEKASVINLHRNAQRLLKPLHVINPYADQLTFLSDKTRTRRDHEKYLTLIDSIALLHQYQREIKTLLVGQQEIQYVEVTLEDIETANKIASEVLGKTLDELPPQTRKLLTHITEWARDECAAKKIDAQDFRFSRRSVRQLCGWSEKQIRVHMQRLVEMEYLLVHRGGRGQSFEYELLYQGEGDNGESFIMGLLGVEQLRKKHSKTEKKEKTNSTTSTSWGKNGKFVAPSCPQSGGVVDRGKPLQPLNGQAYKESSSIEYENASGGL